jgi:hypothetical protein
MSNCKVVDRREMIKCFGDKNWDYAEIKTIILAISCHRENSII